MSRQLIDLTGKIFGKIKVISLKSKGPARWNVVCHGCDKHYSIEGNDLTRTDRPTRECRSCAKIQNLGGQKFGRWTVIKIDKSKPPVRRQHYWLCYCKCNKEKIHSISGATLRHNQSKSCGCLKSEMSSKRIKENPTLLICKEKNPEKYQRYLKYLSDRWLKDKNPNYLKDLTEQERIKLDRRMLLGYREWIVSIHEKFDYKCCKCKNNRKLKAHHIMNFKQHPELRLNLNNGVTLCEACHIKFHQQYGSKDNNFNQLLEFIGSALLSFFDDNDLKNLS